MFTNRITGRIAAGWTGAEAAVESVKHLAIIEIICVAAGIAAVQLLPKIRKRGITNEAEG